jgi:hypothetical protein
MVEYSINALIGEVEVTLTAMGDRKRPVGNVDQEWTDFAQYMENLVVDTLKQSMEQYSVVIKEWRELS